MRRTGYWLRRMADRIDYDHAPKATGWCFTFEPGEGITFHNDSRGCRVWHMQDDYERAHTEAKGHCLVSTDMIPPPMDEPPPPPPKELVTMTDHPACNCGHEFEPDPRWFHLGQCAYRRSFGSTRTGWNAGVPVTGNHDYVVDIVCQTNTQPNPPRLSNRTYPRNTE